MDENGLVVDVATYQRGMMWLGDDDKATNTLEKANGGNKIQWCADLGYE